MPISLYLSVSHQGYIHPGLEVRVCGMNDTLFNRMRKSLEPSAQASIPACPQPASGSTQVPDRCVLQPPAHRLSFPSAARLGFQLCVIFILSLKAPPPPCPPFSEQPTATYASNSGFKIFSSKTPVPAHPQRSSRLSELLLCLSTCSPHATFYQTPHYRTHLLPFSTDSPMMRRTVIYVSLQPKCPTQNWHRIAIG